jgi:uncharacterized membrane protein
MELTPEERRKIYEEEKARIEGEDRREREKGAPVYDTSTGLAPNVAALLCYLGWWVTGLIFFILEQKNAWVRFHAAQSIVFFGAFTIAIIVVSWIPVVGGIIAGIISIIAFIFWIVLMVKAYQGERYMVAGAGELAERMATPAGQAPDFRYTPTSPPPAAAAPPPEGVAREAPPARPEEADRAALRRDEREARRYRRATREARIAGSAVAIAWFIVLLLFFNLFYQYAAYYSADTANGVVTWTRYPFFTSEISRWQPILNVTLGVAIAGHFLLMFLDNIVLRRSIRVVMDGLGLATVVALLTVYPFDFSVIPDGTAAAIAQAAVTAVLIVIAIGFGISLIVRIIKLLVAAGRALSGTEEAE